jgi:hypothetical protein
VIQTRVTCTTRELLVEANPNARMSSLMVEVAHSVQEGHHRHCRQGIEGRW